MRGKQADALVVDDEGCFEFEVTIATVADEGGAWGWRQIVHMDCPLGKSGRHPT